MTSHKYIPPKSMPGGHKWWTCHECGKRAYPDREAAKRAIKTHIEKRGLRPYRCGEMWHIGHIATPVITGQASRHNIYGSAA